MKTKEYVDKYNLSKGTKFSHNEFVNDLAVDFMTLLEVGNGNTNIKGFNNAVNAIKMKFDAINNKVLGDISKIWGFFFATIIIKTKEQLFPEVYRQEQEARDKKKRQWEERKRWEDFESSYNSYFGFEDFIFGLLAKQARMAVPIQSFTELNLESTASIEDVKSAYKKLSLLHHPDKGGNQEKFIQITEAKNKCIAYLTQKQ